MKHKISVTILVKNAQSTLKECLESVRDFDEIILLDNGSTDKTLQIAREFNESYKNLRIEQSEFIGFGALKNLAVSFAKNEWILSLDSDEVLESSALSEINALDLQQNQIYALPRKNLYRGEWIKACGWYPDFVWRIFNKNFTRFNDNAVHESIIIPPNTQKIHLKGAIKHYACSGIPQLLDKLQRYTTLYAEQNAQIADFRTAQKIAHKATLSRAITHSLWGFVKNYFFKKGIFYGYKGFVISVCNALGSFFKYAKLYEAIRPNPANTTLIITTYNQKARLALVLDSVRALNPLPKEVLIADDGSTSDTRELIESYQQDFPCELRHIWHEDKGFRLARIRNRAIDSARGKYIIIIDGDMILDSRFVAEHLRFAQRGVFLQGSRVILRENETDKILSQNNFALAFESRSFKATHCHFCANLIYKFSKTTAKIFKKKELIKGIRGCNMSFFKSDCEAINGFNEEFVGWGREDSEFVARFLFNGGEMRRVKFNAIAYHLYHPENSRATLESNHNIYIYIYAKLKRLGQKWAYKSHKKGEIAESKLDSANRTKSAESSKKRIVITLKDITESGGGERVGANLANAFSANLGYKVQIVSFFKSGAKPFYPLDSRVSCVYLCTSPAKGKNALINLFHKTLFRAWLCLKVHKIATQSDIILANDGWFVPLFRDRARFLVRLWHLNAPKRARKKLRLYDALVILSGREMGRWQRYHSNINAIPNFLPTIPQVSTNHSQKVVLSVGRMSSEKGFLRLIDIWKVVQTKIVDCHDSALPNLAMTIPHPSLRVSETNEAIQTYCHTEGIARSISNKNDRDSSLHTSAPLRMTKCLDFANLNEWKLIIVGDGILKSEIESKIRALNLGESVILKPFTKDIECEYLGASIYAMASHFEGFGMVLAEASSYELPCIAFDIATGPSDIIEHNKSGFLIADNDLESYANHLITLMRDETLRAQFGAESREIIQKRFSKEVVLQKWADLFGEM